MVFKWISKAARATTMVVANLAVAIQPVLAQSIVAEGPNGPTVLRTNNGINMVMIEEPNSAGVSVNTYDQFNVPTSGVILNNIDSNYGVTNLGGFVQGNANLSDSTASLIINEVTSTKPSELLGYIEVAGDTADVVVANAYGITCDGCGFINTDHVALTTGSLSYDAAGALDTISVDRGVIAIGAGGADARGVSQFDLISRQVNFAGAVQGQRVLVIAGQNDVVFATGATEVRSGEGSDAPEYAIDSTVFGGMYANKITIVSTERGSGVRAPSKMVSSAQGMSITADGRLVLGQASSEGRLTARSRSNSVVVRETVYSREALSIEAKQDMIVAADGVIVSDAAATLTSGRHVMVGDSGQIASRDKLTLNLGQTLKLSQDAKLMSFRDMNITGARADLNAGSLIYAGAADAGDTPATARLNFDLSGDADLDSASLYSTGALTFDARDITITASDAAKPAQLVSLGQLAVSGRNLTSTAARLEGAGNVNVALEQALTTGSGTVVAAGQQLAIRSDEMVLAGTVLQADGRVTVAGDDGAITTTSTTIVAGGVDGLRVTAQSLDLDGTIIAAAGDARLTATNGTLGFSGTTQAQGDLTATATRAMTTAGQLQGNGSVTLGATGIENSADIYGGQVAISAMTGNLTNDGVITTPGALALTSAGDLGNAGQIQAGGAAVVSAGASLSNSGDIGSAGNLGIAAASISNTGDLATNGTLTLAANADLTTAGTLQSTGALSLTAGTTLISSSAIISNTGLVMTAGGDILNSGNFATTGDFVVTAGGALANSGTSLAAGQAGAQSITLRGQSITNDGTLAAAADVSLTAQTGAINNAAALTALNDLTVTAATDLTTSGAIAAGGDMTLTATAGTLVQGGTVQAQGALVMSAADDLSNAAALTSNGDVTLVSGGNLSNTGGFLSGGAVAMRAGGTLVNNGSGLSTSGASAMSLTLTGTSVNNSGQAVIANAILLESTAAGTTNSGALTAGGGIVTDAATTLSNSGALLAGGAITLDADGALTNDAGVQTAAALAISGDAINNTGALTAANTLTLVALADLTTAGQLQSGGALSLTAGGDLVSDSGLLSQDRISMAAGGDLTSRGGLATSGAVTMTAAGALQSESGALLAGQAVGQSVSLTGASVTNSGALVVAGEVDFTTTGGTLTNAGSIAAAGDVTFTSQAAISNSAAIAAAGGVTLTATTALANTGALETQSALALNAGTVLTNAGTMHAGTRISATAGGRLTNDGGFQTAGALTLTAGRTLTNNGSGLAPSGASAAQMTLRGADVVNTGDVIVAGTVDLTATVGGLNNIGDLSASGAVTLSAADALTNSGALSTAQALTLRGAGIANSGALSTNTTLLLDAQRGALSNDATLVALGTINLHAATALTNTGDLTAADALTLTGGAGGVDNSGGLLSSAVITLTSTGATINTGSGLAITGASARQLVMNGASVQNAGDFIVQQTVALNGGAGGITQSGELLSGGNTTLTTAGTAAIGGTILTGGHFAAQAGSLASNGRITAQGAATLTTTSGALTQSGTLRSNGDVSLTSVGAISQSGILQSTESNVTLNGVNATVNGTISAQGTLSAALSGALVNTGTLWANDSVSLAARSATMGGQITGLNGVTVTGNTGQVVALNGLLQSNGDVVVTAGTLNTGAGADIASSTQSITLTASGAMNLNGLIRTGQNLTATGASMVQDATIAAALTTTLTTTGTDYTQNGDIATGAVVISAARHLTIAGDINGAASLTAVGNFINSGTIAGNLLLVSANAMTNTASGALTTDAVQQITTTAGLTNRGAMTAAGNLSVNAGGTLNNYGRIDSQAQLSLNAAAVNIFAGARAEGADVVMNTGAAVNEGRIQSSGLMSLTASSLNNSGNIQSGDALGITTGNLRNSGRIDAFGGALILEGLATLNNSGGRLSSDTGVQIGISNAVDFGAASWGNVQSDGWLTLQGLNGGYMSALTVGAGEEIVANGALYIKARGINNNGTIASATDNLILQSQGGISNTGVLYAGGDLLALRASGNIVNDGGAILAMNDIVVCGIATANCLANLSADRAASLTNRNGGVIESFSGNVTLAANTILNERDGPATITTSGRTNETSVTIGRDTCRTVLCLGDDSHHYTINRSYDQTTTVSLNGAMSTIAAGGSITLNAVSIGNSYSLISAGQNISVESGSLTNLGANSFLATVTQSERWYYDDGFLGANRDSLVGIINTTTATSNLVPEFGRIEAIGSISGTITGYLTNGALDPSAASLSVLTASVPSVSGNGQTASAASGQGFSGVAAPVIGGVGNVGNLTLASQSVSAGTANAGLSGLTLPNTVGALTLAPRGYIPPSIDPVTTGTGGTTIDTSGTGVSVDAPTRMALSDLVPAGAGNLPPSSGNANPDAIIGELDLTVLGNE